MVLKVFRFVNLVLAGLLAGNEFGTKVALHPSLEKLGVPERIRAEQEVTRRYGEIMPYWMPSVIVSCLPVLSRGKAGFLPTLAGTLCFVGMLASTAIGNIPINNRVLELSPETDGEEFAGLRERWDRLHTLRVVLNVAGLAFLSLGALRGDDDLKERRGRRSVRAKSVPLFGARVATGLGWMSVGALAIGRLAVKRGRVGRLRIDDLEVGRLRVEELVVERREEGERA